ncbi:MAG: HAD family phosphatase [Sedimentisphaerales bacterium]|nr:HAD family phosphatase [Sedimentisphaerales bacterium]
MSLRNNKNCAYIFDFDGVLVDSMQLHFQCLARVCHNVGIRVRFDEFAAHAGIPTRQQIIWHAKKKTHPVDTENMLSQYRKLFVAGIDQIQPIECNINLMTMLRNVGIKTAIASSSLAEFVLPTTKRFGIVCDAIITVDDVKNGKPAPDLFLKAASALESKPADCIVIEDADIGVEAAYRAGMAVLRYSTPYGETARKNTTTIINVPEFTAA